MDLNPSINPHFTNVPVCPLQRHLCEEWTEVFLPELDIFLLQWLNSVRRHCAWKTVVRGQLLHSSDFRGNTGSIILRTEEALLSSVTSVHV